MHESHVGWVSKLCDYTETGKQPAYQKTKTSALHYQYGIFYNIFVSEFFLAFGIKPHAIITPGSATKLVLYNARKINTTFQRVF